MGHNIIFFDLDGTLTDPKEGITKSVKYALNAFGIQVHNLDSLTCFIGPPLLSSFMEYYNFSRNDAEFAVKKYRERFSSVGIFENKVYSGVPEMLKILKSNGKTLCIATSKPTVFADRILDKFDLKKYFTQIMGSELDGTRCDKADVIKELMEIISNKGIAADNAVMVGDRKHDIIGAKANGLTSVGVEFGYAEKYELANAGADYIAANMEELLSILSKI